LTEATVAKKSKSTMKLSATVARALREGALWFLGAVALLLVLALLSYHKDDASFWNTGDGGSVHNWIGPVGAWLAGFFFSLFGRPAYLFPAMLAYAGWLVHKEQPLPDARSRINTILRAAGFGVTLLTSCGLANLHWDGTAFPSSAGGVVGEFVGDHSKEALQFLGATLLLLALWFSGVALFLGVSWFDVMDKLGAWVLKGINWAQTKLEQRRELASGQQRKQARQGVVREEQKKVASRPPPRIEPVAPIPEKSERIERERQVPLFDAPKSSELPALSLLDEPRAREQ
jgi:S-DNA-T family DNA segregation ATPase FtsK/SpoIIIE